MFTDHKEMKIKNIKKVLNAVAGQEEITRKEIADKTNLSLMSISKIIDELHEMEIVSFQYEKNDNKYGRKADLVTIDQNSRYILIIDLTQRNPIYTVLNLRFYSVFPPATFRYSGAKSYNENINAMLEQIREFLNVSKIPEKKIIGVGMCVPGPYMEDEDTCINNRIKELSGVKLKKKIKSFFGCEVIFIDEDVKLAATANTYYVKDADKKIIMYLYLGEGVGGAVIAGGAPLRGLNGVTGDAGQMIGSKSENGGENKFYNYENLISLPAFYGRVTGKPCEDLSENEMISDINLVKKSNLSVFEREISVLYERISDFVYNIFWLIDPHIFIIECEYIKKIDENFQLKLHFLFEEAMGNRLPLKPQIIYSSRDMKDCHRGAAIEILHMWIQNQF